MGRRTIIRNQITRGLASQQGSVAESQRRPAATKRSSKNRIKLSTVAIYASVFVLLVTMIGVGYQAPQDASTVANAATPVSATQKTDNSETTAVNEVVASTIAASVANATNLSVAPSVSSLAISTKIESELPTTDDASITKPQILQVESERRDVITHKVETGDTVDSVAREYGISKDTVKWANDLTSDNLTVGSTLDILPRTGVLHTVASGDTVASIAEKYKADASIVTSFNDLEIAGVSNGQKIVVPGGVLPTTERPGYVAPVTTPSYSTGSVASSSNYYSSSYRSGSVGNRYAYGNCTWYAYERRAAIGRPVGSFWGNANTWAYAASSQGYSVSNSPSVGAVLVDQAGYYGHVGVVEQVLANGDIVISEMNNAAYGGFNIVNNRTISAGQAGLYRYIH